MFPILTKLRGIFQICQKPQKDSERWNVSSHRAYDKPTNHLIWYGFLVRLSVREHTADVVTLAIYWTKNTVVSDDAWRTCAIHIQILAVDTALDYTILLRDFYFRYFDLILSDCRLSRKIYQQVESIQRFVEFSLSEVEKMLTSNVKVDAKSNQASF